MRRHLSELDRMRAHFTSQGWNPADLDDFRMEADGDDGGDSGDQSGDDDGGGDDGGADLGDAGKAAIDKERKSARDAKKALKPWQTIGTEFNLSPDQVRDALSKLNAGDDEAALRKIQADADKAANTKANVRIVRAEVRVLAADTFADAGDAVLNLADKIGEYEVDDDGNVDADAIKADLEAVLKQKPHLAKNGKRPAPDPSQGSKGEAKKTTTPGLGTLTAAYEATAKTPQQ